MSHRILAVDDSITVRKMIEFALKSRGYTVLAANDGLEAVKLLELNTVDLIVLDINMPNLDGLSFLKLVRERADWKALPILMLTTEGQEADRDRAMELGASAYMVKPFRPTELLSQVGALLG